MGRLTDKILAQITPKIIAEEIDNIQKVDIPANLQKWVTKYEEVGNRNKFVWQLFLKTDNEADYIHREKSSRKSQQELRFLITMFVMLADDAADMDQSELLLKDLIEIPFKHNFAQPNCIYSKNTVESSYIDFALKIWGRINKIVKKTPQYKKLRGMFFYDIKQMIGAMEYSYLINQNPNLINKTEYWIYSPHTMQLIIGISFDIMYLPNFNVGELGILREIIWHSLKMTRIGNCISTWERELDDDDYTSGVFAYAIDSGVISVDELSKHRKTEIAVRINNSTIEDQMLEEWEICYHEIAKRIEQIKTIDVTRLLLSIEKLLSIEMITKKYK